MIFPLRTHSTGVRPRFSVFGRGYCEGHADMVFSSGIEQARELHRPIWRRLAPLAYVLRHRGIWRSMRHFDLVTAKDTNHAVMLLAQHSATSKVRIVAGGTDLMADLKFAPASHAPDVVVDISRADELKHIV